VQAAFIKHTAYTPAVTYSGKKYPKIKKSNPAPPVFLAAILEKRKIFRAGAMSFVRVQGSPEGAYQEVCNVGADSVNRAKIVVPVRKIFRFSSIYAHTVVLFRISL